MSKQAINLYIDNNQQRFIDASDAIWDLAEIKFDVKHSGQQLMDLLSSEGFTIEQGISGMESAFEATFGNGGVVIGVLAEYDALPGMSQQANCAEKKAVEHDGNGHGCGHNALGVGAVAGAMAIASVIKEKNLNATIKVFGTPAEEMGYGKSYMARDGVFDVCDCIMTWHPMASTGVWGYSTLAVNQLYFEFSGVSSHAGANPEMGRSALDAAELMNVGVQFLREHIIDQARIHYAFIDVGGTAANVVQSSAKLHYFIRAPKQKGANDITERVIKIAKGAAMMTETEVNVVWDAAAAEYIVNKTMGDVMYANLVEVAPSYTEEEYKYAQAYFDSLPATTKAQLKNRFKAVFPSKTDEEIEQLASASINGELDPCIYTDRPITGSTDVGDASWIAPTGQITVAYGPNGSGPHCWQWVAMGKSSVAHKALLTAGRVIAMSALDLIENPELVEKAKQEHKRTLGSTHYESALPKDRKPQ